LTSNEEYEALIEARKRIVWSAGHARDQGISGENWRNNQLIKDFVVKHFLDDEVEHIVSYIWQHWSIREDEPDDEERNGPLY